MAGACATAEEQQKKWEFGAGMGTLSIPDYRGSREYQSYALPIPYVIYHGAFIKADRRGVRGQIMESEQFEFNISLNASLVPENDDNPVRRGMPGLDPTFEIGPAFSINLDGETMEEGWLAYIPARAVIAFDKDSVHQIGWVLQPQLAYRQPANSGGWRFTYNAGVYYGDRDYHDYYYTVAPQYVTASRPEYEASAGYSGFSTQIALSRRHAHYWYGGYLRYDNLGDATFEDSPLVETEHYWVLGLAMSWIFSR
jgi:MipA family protein